MRTLLLLRHAKSSWDDSGLRDHDRPLNDRGQRDAPRIGELLTELGKVPDAILASSAVRARTTAEQVAAAAGLDDAAITVCDDLYLASPRTILDVVRRRGSDAGRVMVVAHNPGLEDLVGALGGRHERMPTAALAAFTFDIAQWSDVGADDPVEFDGLWRPKELGD